MFGVRGEASTGTYDSAVSRVCAMRDVANAFCLMLDVLFEVVRFESRMERERERERDILFETGFAC